LCGGHPQADSHKIWHACCPRNVINVSIFCDKIFRGFRSTGGQSPRFPIDFAGHRYNGNRGLCLYLIKPDSRSPRLAQRLTRITFPAILRSRCPKSRSLGTKYDKNRSWRISSSQMALFISNQNHDHLQYILHILYVSLLKMHISHNNSLPFSLSHAFHFREIEKWKNRIFREKFRLLQRHADPNSLTPPTPTHRWIRFMSISVGFYRAMHFSAKRGIAIACRLSVCL